MQSTLKLLTTLTSLSTVFSLANISLNQSITHFEHLRLQHQFPSYQLHKTNPSIMSSDTAPASPLYTPIREDDIEGEVIFHDTIERRGTTTSNPSSVASNEHSIQSQIHPTNLGEIPLTIVPTMTSITIGGVTIAVEATEQTRTTTGALYTKAIRETYDDDKKGKLDLLKLVQSKQQQPYVAISISVNDPEKLLNHYSLSKLNKECLRNLTKYDLIGPFTIVFPLTPEAVDLRKDTTGTAFLTHDLLSNTIRVTAQQVADSSRWYSGFTAPSARFQEDLEWSLAYFENNVDSALYARIHAKLLTYDERSRGGPLFFKLLNDETTTTSDSNKKALITIVDTYKIRVSCKGEKIPDVIDLFRAITDTVFALHDDTLPDEYVDKLIEIFTTTSIQLFNDLFEELKKQLFAASLQASIADALIVPVGGASTLANNLKGAYYVLNYANQAYWTLFQKGAWDKCLQQAPGDPAIHHTPNGDSIPPTTPSSSGIRCFNCDGNHHLRQCDKPRDQARINKNRGDHPNGESGSKQPTGFRNGRPFTRPAKWRLPEEGEHNKRIIDMKPYTFNPTTKRWDPDTTPTSGGVPLANVIPPAIPPPLTLPPTPTFAPSLPSPDMKGAFFNGYGSPPSMDKEAQKHYLARQMVQLKQAYESL